MWKVLFTAVILAIMLHACGSQEEPDRASFFSEGTTNASMAAAVHTMDVGDIESSVTIEVFPATGFEAPNISVDMEKSIKGQFTQCTITIKPPYPASLPLEFRVTPRDPIPGSKRPVVLRGSILRENQPVQPFNLTLGESSPNKVFPVRVPYDPLQGLQQPVKTLLVFAQVEAFFLPEGTDAASLDIASAQPENGISGAIMSNPVRINFVSAEGKP
ncbi:MAG TPA: hypothetical protein PLI09_18195 [Candidatus Hydrogenedentes bacterium]|nr:hypothetical protein [Candidatus Hydrogenedentota bacterium]